MPRHRRADAVGAALNVGAGVFDAAVQVGQVKLAARVGFSRPARMAEADAGCSNSRNSARQPGRGATGEP